MSENRSILSDIEVVKKVPPWRLLLARPSRPIRGFTISLSLWLFRQDVIAFSGDTQSYSRAVAPKVASVERLEENKIRAGDFYLASRGLVVTANKINASATKAIIHLISVTAIRLKP